MSKTTLKLQAEKPTCTHVPLFQAAALGGSGPNGEVVLSREHEHAGSDYYSD